MHKFDQVKIRNAPTQKSNPKFQSILVSCFFKEKIKVGVQMDESRNRIRAPPTRVPRELGAQRYHQNPIRKLLIISSPQYISHCSMLINITPMLFNQNSKPNCNQSTSINLSPNALTLPPFVPSYYYLNCLKLNLEG